jgi:drug/metabolite transporter (DMT)-like permease
MATWMILVVLGQAINALVVLVDRYLVRKQFGGKPVVYTFYVGLLSGVVLILVPFGVVSPLSTFGFLVCVGIAASSILGLLYLYKALLITDASDTVPVTGSLTALASFIFSFFLLGSALPDHFIPGFLLLIVGMLFVSHFRFSPRAILYVLLVGFFLGLSTVLIKILFLETNFIDGFFWSRMANFAGALCLLAWPNNAKAILSRAAVPHRKTSYILVLNKVLAGIAMLFILIAINLGNVTLVNALAALQFVFLLFFVGFVHKFLPEMIFTPLRRRDIIQKVISTAIIIVGFFFIFL